MSAPELAWGLHAVREALERHPERVKELWVLNSRADRRMADLLELARAQGLAPQSVRRETLDRMAEGGPHQGVVARMAPTPADRKSVV